MSGNEKITVDSIESICSEFGFGYEVREGKHFATVCEELKVNFDEGGKLSGGRQKFLERARKANSEFCRAYPGSQGASRRAGKPKLSRSFLRKYKVDALETAMELIEKLIDQTKESERLAGEIGNAEARLNRLKAAAEVIEEVGLGSFSAMTPKIREVEAKLAELIREKKEVDAKPITAGEEGKESTEEKPIAGGEEGKESTEEKPIAGGEEGKGEH